MITLIAFAGASAAAALAADPDLAADAKLAMKRADLSLDYVARCTGIPHSRLSDQLNGKLPFTGFWRFFVGDMRETDFRVEFLELQADRLNRVLVRADLGLLLARVETLIAASRKPMVKAALPEDGQKAQVG